MLAPHAVYTTYHVCVITSYVASLNPKSLIFITCLQEGEDSMEAMDKALKFILIWGGLLAIILIPIWPLLALAAGTFSQGQLGSLCMNPRQLARCQPVAYDIDCKHWLWLWLTCSCLTQL